MDHIRLAVQLKGPSRLETFMGREHVSVPAVLVRSQVLENNLGKTYLPPDEITPEWAEAANGSPVVIDHPTQRGFPISAKEPGVMNSMGVGFLFNARVEDESLKGDVFLDPSRATAVTGLAAVLEALDAGRTVELSTGFPLRAVEEVPGVHNGQAYDRVLRPGGFDHLAVFAEKKGACSVKDGCGLGINHEGACNCGGDKKHEGVLAQAVEKLTALARRLGVVPEGENKEAPEPVVNAGDPPKEESEMNREQMIAQLAAAGTDKDALGKLSDAQLQALCGKPAEQPKGDGWDKAHQYRQELDELKAQTANARETEKKELVELLDDVLYTQRRSPAAVPWSDNELRAMDVVALRKVHAAVCGRPSYAGRGAPRIGNGASFVRGIMDGHQGDSILDQERN